MLDSLFRQEVIDAYYERWLGEPRLGRSLSSWLLCLLGVAAIVSLFILVSVETYARRVVIAGVIVPQVEPLDVASPVAGRVVGIFVHQGDGVHAWQPLFEIVPDEAQRGAGYRSTRNSVFRLAGSPKKSLLCFDSNRGSKSAAPGGDDVSGTCFRQSSCSLIIVSTTSGNVVDVVASSGQAVTRGQLMGRILSGNTQLVAREFVSQDQLRAIQKGQDVLLRLSLTDELPAIPGKIASVVPGVAPYTTSLSLGTREATTYAVDIGIPQTVALSGKEPLVLTAGMGFSSSLLVDSRPIYRLMFPSLYSKSH